MKQSFSNIAANRNKSRRNSNESIKASFSMSQANKGLPQIAIDLSSIQKKVNLELQQRTAEALQYKQSFPETSRVGKNVKKQSLYNYLHNTEDLRMSSENKSILKEYRDEIQLLKLENQRIKSENQRLKKNGEFLSRKLNEVQSRKNTDQTQLKEYANCLEAKLEQYSWKIKQLFQELIRIKKSGVVGEDEKCYEKTSHSGLHQELNWHRETRQPYTYRLQQNESEVSRQRLTPSSHGRQKVSWAEEEIDNLMWLEKKGEEAYYRLEGHGTLNQEYP